MSLFRPNPPPPRQGVSAGCVVTPPGPWATVLDFLCVRFGNIARAQWTTRLQAGDVVDDHGELIRTTTPFQPAQRLYYFRSLQAEQPIPFTADILWQNEHLLVVDKPHFLPVLPSGKYLQETVLVRLKNAMDCDELSPIHRIDRDTAGLVLFSKQRATRNAFQTLFRQREVEKTYEAVAPWEPSLPWPLTRETRIAPAQHFMQQTEVAGAPNAITYIEPMEIHGSLARYRLRPVTGHRHQLRVHMAALGLPIVGDGIYPTLTPEGSLNYSQPLQLLARSIAFTDPLSGEERAFHSQRQLRTLQELTPTAP